MSKKFRDLDLSNAFLFAAALEDEEICRLILEIILGQQISQVKVHAEHSILVSADYRSVRLDVYASDEMQVACNVEMQNEDCRNLAKRSRLHQAQMDVASIKPGEDFNQLKPCFIIFICTFDPFGKGLYRYTFESRCLENNISLGDGVCRIFLNTKGTNEDGVPAGLIHFLRYVEQSTDTCARQWEDPAIARLHEKVTKLKDWNELEERYVTFEELLNDRGNKEKSLGLAEGRAQGKAEGLAQGTAQGKAESVLELLSEYGDIPEELKARILGERDTVILGSWLKAAARCNSVSSFREKTNI